MARRIDIKRLVKLIRDAQKILVATHLNPDGDGLGSILALGEGLRSLGKKVTLFTSDLVPKMYRFLPGQEKIVHQLSPNECFDLSFIVDLGEIERGGEVFAKHRGRGLTVSIDHHIRGVHDCDLDFNLPKQAASGEVVYKILKALRVKLSRSMATNIYTAIVTDTGSFKYSNTTPETFAIAAKLAKHKLNVWQVALNCFETYSAPRMALLRRVLNTLEIHPSGKIAWIVLYQKDLDETGAAPDESEGFINFPRAIESVEVAIHFKEIAANRFKLSLRSKNTLDVARIAEGFGGGGHIRASGFKMDGTLAEIREKVLAVILPQLKG